MILGELQSNQISLRSGSICGKSTKKLGITNHHHKLPSFLRLQHEALVRNTDSGTSVCIFCGVLSGCDVLWMGLLYFTCKHLIKLYFPVNKAQICLRPHVTGSGPCQQKQGGYNSLFYFIFKIVF